MGSAPGCQRTYRSPAADALALPGFTYGLDIVLLVGRLHPCLAPDGRRSPRRTAGVPGTAGREDLAARDPLSVRGVLHALASGQRGQRRSAVACAGKEE